MYSGQTEIRRLQLHLLPVFFQLLLQLNHHALIHAVLIAADGAADTYYLVSLRA